MTPFQLYKHINNTDVAIMPMDIIYDQHTDLYHLRVRWFNIVLKRNLDMDVLQDITIRGSDLNSWKHYPAE